MIKLLHTGDVHLGYRQYNLKQRADDFVNAFYEVINIAVAEKIDILIIGGDLFEHAKPEPSDIHKARVAVESLKKTGINVIGMPGTHDGNPYIYKLCNIEDIAVINGVKIKCIPTIRQPNKLQEALLSLDKSINILVLHQGLKEAFPFSYELDFETLRALVADTDINLVLLAHIHKWQIFESDKIKAVYCGSTEMNDITEQTDKSCNLITYDETNKKVINIERKYIKIVPPKVFTITTEEELNKVYSELQPDSLCYIKLVPELHGLTEKFYVKAEELNIRLHITNYSVDKEESFDIHEIESWDKSKVLPDIKNIVESEYPQDSDEYRLITALLDNPDGYQEIIENYIGAA